MTLLLLWTTVSPFCSHGLWELQDPPQWGAIALGPHRVSCLLQLLSGHPSHWLFQEGPLHFLQTPQLCSSHWLLQEGPNHIPFELPRDPGCLDRLWRVALTGHPGTGTEG